MAPSGRPGAERRLVSDRRQPASESDLIALGRRRSSSPGSLLVNSKIFHTLLTAQFDVYSYSRNSATQQNVNVKMSLLLRIAMAHGKFVCLSVHDIFVQC